MLSWILSFEDVAKASCHDKLQFVFRASNSPEFRTFTKIIADSYFVQIFTNVCWSSSYHKLNNPLPSFLNKVYCSFSLINTCEVCWVGDRERKAYEHYHFFLQIILSKMESETLESALIKKLAGSPDTLFSTTNLKANSGFTIFLHFPL